MKHILSYFLPLTPFTVELISDYVMIVVKKKKDWFRLNHRVLMIIGVALIFILLTPERNFKDVDMFLIIAVAPYLFFDYALNKMRGLKWYYLSTSNGKWWDENLHRVNPYALLTARIVIACVLLGLIIRL